MSVLQIYKNESTIFPGKPEDAYYGMLATYDDLKVAKQELRTCPEPGCNYSSSNKSDLKDHINSKHIHYPASICEICSERFFTKRNYNRHRRSHHFAELTHSTPEVVQTTGKRFREDDNETLNHKLILPLTNESTIFTGDSQQAYNAMVSHYKKLKFCKSEQIKCPERNCNYYCNNKTDLQGHINSRHIHHRVIECEVCKEWFFTQKAAHSHRKNRHPNLESKGDDDASNEEDSETDFEREGSSTTKTQAFRVPFTHLSKDTPRQQSTQAQLERQALCFATSQYNLLSTLLSRGNPRQRLSGEEAAELEFFSAFFSKSTGPMSGDTDTDSSSENVEVAGS